MQFNIGMINGFSNESIKNHHLWAGIANSSYESCNFEH